MHHLEFLGSASASATLSTTAPASIAVTTSPDGAARPPVAQLEGRRQHVADLLASIVVAAATGHVSRAAVGRLKNDLVAMRFGAVLQALNSSGAKLVRAGPGPRAGKSPAARLRARRTSR